MSFSQAVSAYYKNFADFEGRTSRPGFWWVALYQFAVYIVLSFLVAVDPLFSFSLFGIFAIVHIVPSLAVGVRRLHDSGLSGWHILWGLIPFFIGFIIIVVLMLRPTVEPDAAVAGASNEWDDLERLAELRDKGVITAEEFEAKKRDFLNPRSS